MGLVPLPQVFHPKIPTGHNKTPRAKSCQVNRPIRTTPANADQKPASHAHRRRTHIYQSRLVYCLRNTSRQDHHGSSRVSRSVDLFVPRLGDRVRPCCQVYRFIGFNKISHENIRGKRAASGGAGLNVSVPAIISKRWSRWVDQEKPDKQGWRGGMHRHQ